LRRVSMHISRFLPILVVLGCTVGSGQERRVAQLQGAECPLSETKQLEAVRRFKALMPVFHHPRCANCHGGIDFFSAGYEDLHGGAAVEMIDGEVRGPDGSVISRRRPDFTTCGTCHDAAAPRRWEFPHPGMDISFAGRSAGQICEQIKRSGSSGDPSSFLENHIQDDALIRLGFEGRRGHKTLSPLPPPMTAAEFNAKVASWLESMKIEENDWPQPASCGCIAPEVWYGTVTYQQVLDVTNDEGDYAWVADSSLLYWTDGYPGKLKAQAEFNFDGPEGYWTAKGRYDAISPCVKLTSNISGSGRAKLSVGEWDPLRNEELPSVSVDTRPDGAYTVNLETGELGGKSLYKVIARYHGEARCGDSEEAEENTSLTFSAQGQVDPKNPDVLSGTSVITGDGGTVKVTWSLSRQLPSEDK
jgi:hypothetical protein